MVEQTTISIYPKTKESYTLVKLAYQAKIKKELIDNDFILELLECLVNKEKLKID